MKYLLILALFLVSCESQFHKLETHDRLMRAKQDCFDSGGVEFETGESGGSYHNVCIFRKGS